MAAFMRYFRAKEAQYTQDAAYRFYVGNGIQIISENTGRMVGGRQLKDYSEFMGLKPVDNRSGDEIAADIIKRAGLGVKNESI